MRMDIKDNTVVEEKSHNQVSSYNTLEGELLSPLYALLGSITAVLGNRDWSLKYRAVLNLSEKLSTS